MGKSLFRFFASLKLAVCSLLALAAVLAYATVSESLYGMRGAYHLVYGRWWFSGLLALIGLNVLCAALSRFPWKARQTGFVVTHLGIITILVGSFLTQQWGVDGNLAVMEGTQSNLVTMPDMALTVRNEENQIQAQVPVPEFAKRKTGDLLAIVIGDDRLEVKEYLPRLVAEKKYVPSPLGEVGTPALQLAIYNSRFRLEEWLKASHPSVATELDLGPATIGLKKLWTKDEDKALLATPATSQRSIAKAGPIIMVSYEGNRYQIGVDDSLRKWNRIPKSGLEILVERYMPHAIVQNGQLVNKSKTPKNPAVQILARKALGSSGERAGENSQKYTLFALYPEFNTLHHGSSPGDKLGATFQLVLPSAQQAARRGRLDWYVLSNGQDLYFRSIGAAGDLKNQGMAKLGEEIATGWMDLKFKVLSWIPHALEDTTPRYIEEISGSSSNFLSGIRVEHKSTRSPASGSPTWILEGGAQAVPVGRETWTVQYGRRNLELPFAIVLDKFTIGTDPGTTKAAAYESDIRVYMKDRGISKEPIKISMNEPYHFGGYTFYQASYQMEEGKKPISIFSVNFDPGRIVKYLGSIIMVLGIILMFSMNPHYWAKLFGREK